MDDQPVSTLRRIVHPAIAVLAPFLNLLAFDAVVRLGISGNVIPAPPGSMVVVLLLGIGQAVSLNALRTRRLEGFLPRIRGQIVLLVGGLLLLTLVSGRPFRGQLNPFQPDVAWPLFLALVQLLLTSFVQDSLARRERYFASLAGRSGHALQSAARDAGSEGSGALEGIANTRRMEVILQLAVFLLYAGLAIVSTVTGARASGWVTATVMLNVLAGAALMVVLAHFTDEQLAAASGVSWPGVSGLRRLQGPGAGVGLLALLALALAGSRARLPASFLADLLARLQAWFDRLGSRAQAQAATAPALPPPSVDQSLNPMAGLPEATTSHLLETIVRVVGIAIGAALALLIFYLLARPLFRRETWRAARGLHPLRALAGAIQRTLRVLGQLPRALAAGFRAARRGSIPRAFREALRDVMAQAGLAAASRAARLARARRAARNRAVQQFRRIARWGDRHGVSYAPGEGPMEYASRLGAQVPDKAGGIRSALSLFERLVYSPSPGDGGHRELSRIVDGILA